MSFANVENISHKAASDLAYIRDTLSLSSTFTSISGPAIVVIGVLGLITAWLTLNVSSFSIWNAYWLGAACLCALIGAFGAYQKIQRNPASRKVALNTRVLMSLLPIFAMTILLTLGFYKFANNEVVSWELRGYLTSLWLLHYGVAIVTLGFISIRPISYMGVSIAVVGAINIFLPTGAQYIPELMMALGFGLLHIIFGVVIWRKYGG